MQATLPYYEAGRDEYDDYEPEWYADEGEVVEWDEWYERPYPSSPPVGIFVIGSVLMVILLLIFSAVMRQKPTAVAAAPAVAPAPLPTVVPAAKGGEDTAVVPANDLSSLIMPYDDYILTQGPHGFSYGHMAIDLAAGKGSVIKSPLNGEVTDRYVDEYANTVIVIENERYQVTMLHGDYTAGIGQRVRQGEAIGTESNHGYTKDSQGNLCYGRDCGHHTHINIFDKKLSQNINPLDVLQ